MFTKAPRRPSEEGRKSEEGRRSSLESPPKAKSSEEQPGRRPSVEHSPGSEAGGVGGFLGRMTSRRRPSEEGQVPRAPSPPRGGLLSILTSKKTLTRIPSGISNLPWRQKLAGTWKKTERIGFYEFLLFNGAPWVVAFLKKDADFGQILELEEGTEGPTFKITATGFPSGEGPKVKVADSRDAAIPVEYVDSGRHYIQRDWWDEENRQICVYIECPAVHTVVYQTRQVSPLDDDILLLNIEATKEDGRKASYHAKFKRKVKK